MKASKEAPALPLSDPGDFCTVEWAGQTLNRSTRTVRRLIAENLLRTARPRVAHTESGTHRDMLWVAEVEALRDAYLRAGTLFAKTGWRR